MGNFGVFEECLTAEEFAFGCTGITTAIGGTGLGVSHNENKILITLVVP